MSRHHRRFPLLVARTGSVGNLTRLRDGAAIDQIGAAELGVVYRDASEWATSA